MNNYRSLGELAYRLLRARGSALLSFSGWISLAGLVLGVGCLVVSMAVFSGFERTLQRSVSDVSGDLQIYFTPRSGFDVEEELLKNIPGFQGLSGFLATEGILAAGGKVRGVLLQGIESAKASQVLKLGGRVLEGSMLDGVDSKAVMIGKGIAREMGLKAGDEFQVVVLLGGDIDTGKFKRKIATFKVQGVLDLGKFEYDERMVMVDLAELQGFIEVRNKLSGYVVRLDTPERALEVAPQVAATLGAGHRVRTWKDVNENLFEAVIVERRIIFFVILIIVVAAAFNVMGSLFVSVVQHFHDIAVLKAMGFRKKWIMGIFQLQGLMIGAAGCVGGLLLGVIFSLLFEWVQRSLGFVPGAVYKVDAISVHFRWQDLTAVLVSTIVISFLATWLPAKKGANLAPVEGLRYE